MRRYHLFEWEDQGWFPALIRDYMTDFLRFMSNAFDLHKGTVPLLAEALHASGQSTVVDLASGGGGGLAKLAGHLKQEVPDIRIVVTDLFPNRSAFEALSETAPDVFTFETQPVDARNVPQRLKGVRTQFLSFHHFQPGEAIQILQNAVDCGTPIAIFEAQRRDVPHVIKNALSPIFVLLTAPLMRPVRLGRFVFTYLIPIVPLCVMWDGVVSVLRTYSVEEMQELVQRVRGSDSYEWKIGEARSGQVTNPYLVGYPRQPTQA